MFRFNVFFEKRINLKKPLIFNQFICINLSSFSRNFAFAIASKSIPSLTPPSKIFLHHSSQNVFVFARKTRVVWDHGYAGACYWVGRHNRKPFEALLLSFILDNSYDIEARYCDTERITHESSLRLTIVYFTGYFSNPFNSYHSI